MVVAGIMVEVRAGQHHPRARWRHITCKLYHTQLFRKAVGRGGPTQPPTTIVAPAPALLVIPAAVAKMPNLHAMRSATVLTPSFGTLKPDKGGQLAPVDRV